MILKLIQQYPEFKTLYDDVYELCRNIGKVMQMFSKELLEMDRNTVKLMIDEMQEEIKQQAQMIEQQAEDIQKKNEVLEIKDTVLKEKDAELEAAKQQIEMLERKLAER